MDLIQTLKSQHKVDNIYSVRIAGVYPFLAKILEFGSDYLKVVDIDEIEFLVPLSSLATIRDVTGSPAHVWEKEIGNVRRNTGL